MECPNTTVDVSVKRNKDFFTAVVNGDFDEVKRSVQEGASLDTSCNKCYVTALQIAVFKGYEDIVLWLIEKGASVTLPNREGVNAAHLAVQNTNLSVFTAFIDQDKECIGRKVDRKYYKQTKKSRYLISHESGDCHLIKDGFVIIKVIPRFIYNVDSTLLDLAVYFDKLEMVKLLISKGAVPSVVNDGELSNVLLEAVSWKNEMLKYLLDVPEVVSAINVHIKWRKCTALMFAVHYSNLEATKLLLAHGAEVSTRDERGRSVLHIGAYAGNPKVLQALFDAANMSKMIDDKDHFHRTPLMCAVEKGDLKTVNLLVSKGANVNVVDDCGWNVLHIASYEGRKNILKFFLENRHLKKFPSVKFERDKHGLYPLHIAATQGHSDCFDFLNSETGYCLMDSVSSRPWEDLNGGSTMVHAAVVGENISILRKIFVGYKWDLSVEDDESLTPLLLAIEMNNFEVVKQLLINGASLFDRMPGSTGIYGDKTALQIIINYYPQPETILEEVMNSVYFIISVDDKKTPTEALINFGNQTINANNQGNSIESERKSLEYNQFNLVKHLLSCREYKTKEKIILHPVMESLLFLFNKRLSPIYWCLLSLHFICTVTFSNMVSPILKLGTVTWYICMVVVFIWLFFINLQELLFRNTSSDVNVWQRLTFQKVFKVVTSILCIASLENGVVHCIVDLRPFALICVWFHLIFRMSLWYFPGVYLNIFLIVLWKMTRVLFTFCTVFVGFALALRTVFPEANSFKDIFLAITRTLIMTQDLAYGDLITERHSDIAVLVLVVFTLVVSIALANFLIGLAITDVEVLEKHGRVEWLLLRLKFLVDLEATMGSSPWRDYHVTKVIYLYLFNIEDVELYFNTTDFNKNILPSRIVNAVFSIILKRKRCF